MQRSEYLKQRQACLERRDLEGAVEVGAVYLRVAPTDAKAHHSQAWALSALKRYDEALRHQTTAADLAPENLEIKAALDRIQVKTGSLKLTASQLSDRALARFTANEERVKASIHHKIRRALSFAGVTDAASFPWIVDDFLTDETPGWMRLARKPTPAGDVSEVRGIGRYVVDDLSHTVHKRLARGIPWEGPLLSLLMEIASRTDRAVLDIGANIGCHTVPLARIADVYAYEPNKVSFDRLCANLALNQVNVNVRQLALSDVSGFGTMADDDVKNPGKARLIAGTDTAVSALDEEQLPPIGLIKMDVEGHETKVLAGAVRTLSRDKPVIVCEILAKADTASVLEGLGYEGIRVHRSDWIFRHRETVLPF